MFLRIIISQARQKWVITVLLWLAMTALVSLYVYLDNSSEFTNRSMQLIMKNMGHNLLILPKGADLSESYLCGEKQVFFSEKVIEQMAKYRKLASKYYTAVLQQRFDADGVGLVLTGIRPIFRGDETPEKPHLDSEIERGEARLGSEAAAVLAAGAGDEVEVLGRRFEVAEVLPSKGTLDDCRVFVNLADAQEMLGRAGQINMVLGFLCLHGMSLADVSKSLHGELGQKFPEFQVISMTNIAEGRYLARMTTDRFLYYLLGIVLCITVVIIVVTGFQEVNERRQELGILLAMGTNYFYIVGLYIVKLLVIGLAAAVTGFLVGSYLSCYLLGSVLATNTEPMRIIWDQLPNVAVLTVLVALGAEVVPMIKLVRMDPNVILVEE